MRGYKIETFTTISDPTIFPQTPNNETCYDYIKNVKNWNVGQLTDKQKKVIFTMRALLGSQYSDNSKVFPFKDGCVIPKENLPIFNASEETTSLTVSPPNNRNKHITLSSTNETMYPQGLYVDFTDPNMNYDKFRDILDGGYQLYDSEFLIEERRLKNEINRLTRIRDSLNGVLANLVNQTNNVVQMTADLNDPNSECQRAKAQNVTSIQKWNELINQQNYYQNRYWTLWNYSINGLIYHYFLIQVFYNSIGKYVDMTKNPWQFIDIPRTFWFNDGGNVKNISNKQKTTSCYGAPNASSCPTCDSVVKAYQRAGWAYNTKDFEQCN